MMQGKGTLPLPLHPIPSNHRRRKCQGCARSKMSGMLPAVHPTYSRAELRKRIMGLLAHAKKTPITRDHRLTCDHGDYFGCGTILIYGRGAFHPWGYVLR